MSYYVTRTTIDIPAGVGGLGALLSGSASLSLSPTLFSSSTSSSSTYNPKDILTPETKAQMQRDAYNAGQAAAAMAAGAAAQAASLAAAQKILADLQRQQQTIQTNVSSATAAAAAGAQFAALSQGIARQQQAVAAAQAAKAKADADAAASAAAAAESQKKLNEAVARSDAAEAQNRMLTDQQIDQQKRQRTMLIILGSVAGVSLLAGGIMLARKKAA